MRLRLVVQRHNLPDAAIVWAVEPNETPTISQLLEQVNEIIPLESGGDWGLEDYSVEIRGSGANYECLHFQMVRSVLHEDDEVIIRPLLSHDLKLRRVSGRHQISSDGKHLFDGWVFGRPRPHGPIDRPAIDIPPRKRARITYDEETESNLDENFITTERERQLTSDPGGDRQLVLSADFEDDDEDEDEDFEPNSDEEQVEEEEDDDDDDDNSEEDLDGNSAEQHDLAIINGLVDESDGEESPGLIQSVGLKSDMQRLQEAFPEAPLSLCKNVLIGCSKDVGEAWSILSQAFKPSIPRISIKRRSKSQGTHHPASTQSKIKVSSRTKTSSSSSYRKVLEDIGDDEPSPVDVDNSLFRYYDQHGLPEGSISTGKALSDMAKIVSSNHPGQTDQMKGQNSSRRVSTSMKRSTRGAKLSAVNSGLNAPDLLVEDDSDDSDDEDFHIESSSSIDQDISSDDSSDESSDSNKSEGRNGDASSSSKESDTSSSGLTSDSDSESDSDSDQEPEELSSKPSGLEETAAPETEPLAECAINQQYAQQKADDPPGQGKSSTRRRNQRRRTANLLQRYKKKGILPSGASVKDMEHLKLDRAQALKGALQMGAETRPGGSQKSRQLTEKVAAKAFEFDFRRQQLLDSLASGGVEVGSQLISESVAAVPSDSVSKQIDSPGVMPAIEAAELELHLRASVDNNTRGVEVGSVERDAESLNHAMVTTPGDSSTPNFVAPTESSTTESVSRPRRKIDLGAAGRMLFGALGVRTPKNKADHEKVRNDLIKDIRPSKSVPAVDTASTINESSNTGEDPEAWREVINLRAVECCYDNVKLSPAPFPFVQRWDPQQQGGYSMQGNRGGKGKRSKRNQSQYYDYEQQPPKKRKRNRNSYNTYDTNEQHPATNTSEIEDSFHRDNPIQMESVNASGTQNVYSDGIDGAVNDQIMRDVQDAATSEVVDEDDLPRFPEDITTLPNFTGADVKPGIVIAFKQLILSEATKWQPQMSTYRTAVVIRASETGNLELRLAKRDRGRTEKQYDVETGERVYGKFDMPTDDDQNDEEDDGFLEVAMHELMDPKIVQLAPENLVDTVSSPVTPRNQANISADDSPTLYHADSAENSKSSIEAPGEADVETPGHQDLPSDNTDSPLIREGRLLAADEHETQLFSVSEDTREEISVLIKEAGFRTSIPSSVLRAQTQLPASHQPAPDERSYSPKFNGFGSSPEPSSSQPIQAISSPSLFNPTTPPTEDVYGAHDSSEESDNVPASNVQYPKLSLPSSLASQVSDRGRQPDYPIPGEDTLHQLDDFDSILGVHEELSLNRDQDLSSTRPANAGDNAPLNHVKSSPDDSPLSGDLPNLSGVFSTAQSSVGSKPETHPWLPQKTNVKNAKKIEDSYNREMEALDALLEKAEDSEQITPRISEDHGKKELNAQKIAQKTSESQFKIPPGSQQVDLTLSSDGELGLEKENFSDNSYADNSYDNNYGLPRGPGWVEKKTRRTRRQTVGNSQASSQGGARTRSARRKTMTKF